MIKLINQIVLKKINSINKVKKINRNNQMKMKMKKV